MVKCFSILVVALTVTLPATAAVRLNPLFANHMVLQRDRPVPVWGSADPAEKISVTFGADTQTVAAGADGKWMAFLAPMPASKVARSLKVQGTNQLEITDVLVGDVWLGAGQSNMDWSVSATDRVDAVKSTPPGTWDGIRLFRVEQLEIDQPVDEVKGKWVEASTANVVGFSATLFYFGEEIYKRQPDVPLGLVRCSVGATNLYCWLPNEVRDKDPAAEFLRTWWGNAIRGWSQANQDARDQEAAKYLATVEEYKQRNEELPREIKKPGELMGPKWSRRPSALYNGMIAPLQPLSIRGMIWYQGEWDSKREWVVGYHDLFIAFARGLRANWVRASGKKESGAFPIYLVQLPAREPGDGDYWPYMREAQAKLGRDVPNSGSIVTYDTNDPHELHPRAKSPVGQRLAWLALAKEYGQTLPWHGPEMKSAKPDSGGLALEFDPGADTLKSRDGQPLRNFELAGEDGIYHPATGEIRGSTVFVSSPEVPKPATIRYAFNPAPANPNFFNSADLPAAPFRTDTQPIPQKIK